MFHRRIHRSANDTSARATVLLDGEADLILRHVVGKVDLDDEGASDADLHGVTTHALSHNGGSRGGISAMSHPHRVHVFWPA